MTFPDQYIITKHQQCSLCLVVNAKGTAAMSTNPKMKTKKRMRVSRKTKPKPSAPLNGTEAETKMVLTVQIKTGMSAEQV